MNTTEDPFRLRRESTGYDKHMGRVWVSMAVFHPPPTHSHTMWDSDWDGWPFAISLAVDVSEDHLLIPIHRSSNFFPDSRSVGLICEKGNQLQVQSLRKGRTQKTLHPKNKAENCNWWETYRVRVNPILPFCCLFEAVFTPRTLSSVNTRVLYEKLWRKIAHPQSCATNMLHWNWNCLPKTYALQQKRTSFFWPGDFGSLPFLVVQQ